MAGAIVLSGAMCAGIAQSAMQANGQDQPTASIRGTVRDWAGSPVAGALVHAERKDRPGSIDTETDDRGDFLLRVAADGSYVVKAQKGGLESRPAEAESSHGGPKEIALVLEQGQAGTQSAVAAMKFSDEPDFKIAGVTDWTAAGGHGSDAILRTSEALTRDTLHLQPGANAGSGEPARAPEPELRAALALEEAGKIEEARRLVRSQLATQGLAAKTSADLLRMEGRLDEKLGDPVPAAKAFETATRNDPSEENYFQWGSELLLHRAIWQAKDVFTAGAQRYARSPRMLTALGAALFACALYDEAAERLCEAADMNSSSPDAFLFLGKAEAAAPDDLKCAEQHLADFARQQPANPLANYYYAIALWKHSGRSTDAHVREQVEALLNRAVALDPKCSEAYLQLGIVATAGREDAQAIGFYQKAIAADPQLSEAHYRLGVAFDRMGERDKAKQEFQLHEQIERQQKAQVEQQRREVKQFLVVEDKPAEKQP
ncbi:MAG TPA: carboxypeptidase regulatory-like domain-containing protein [Terracidiphilus sp.]|nr:carboxypeptidase regulatory-like domain-containing protein [Terracidiphilus sp.]